MGRHSQYTGKLRQSRQFGVTAVAGHLTARLFAGFVGGGANKGRQPPGLSQDGLQGRMWGGYQDINKLWLTEWTLYPLQEAERILSQDGFRDHRNTKLP